MNLKTLNVGLGERSYTISIGPGLLQNPEKHLPFSLKDKTAFVLTDDNIRDVHGRPLCAALSKAGARSVEMLSLPPGEQTKCYARLEQTLDWLLDHRPDRKSILFAVGGGVIGDLGGVTASLVLRGIPFVQIPTSLLAQVDSSVGGKTGINTRHGKNLVGAFYQPQAVLCDLDALKTLPRREILAGYAEIVKYGLLGDAGFFDWLEQAGEKVCALDHDSVARAVETSCRMKADIVAQDERESGVRALLNLGHTFGHALEAEARFDGRLLHGEAVAIGTVLAFQLSVRRGHCPGEALARIERHFKQVGLPTRIGDIAPPLQCSAENLVAHMDHDKKAEGGRPVFIVADDIGKTRVDRAVDLDDVRAVLVESMQSLRI